MYSLLNNKAKFIELFDIVSKNQAFKSFPRPIIYKKTIYLTNLSNWFRNKEYFTVGELIVAFFEQTILIRFKIYLTKYFKDNCFNLKSILNNKHKNSLNDNNCLNYLVSKKLVDFINKRKSLILFLENNYCKKTTLSDNNKDFNLYNLDFDKVN